MALDPLVRPDGSTQLLRYRGTVGVGAQATATYPKTAGETPSDAVVTGTYFDSYVRFPLFKPGALDFPQKRFPAFVFDDSMLADGAPHDPVACVASPTLGVNVTDLSINRRTWAQNVQLLFHENPAATPLVLSADTAISEDNDPANGAQIVVDTLTSGLGLNTGLPVLIVHFRVLANDAALQAFNIDLSIEIRHTAGR